MRHNAAQVPAVERGDQTPQFGGIKPRINLDPKTISKYDPKLSIRPVTCPSGPRTRSAILNDLDRNNLLVRSRLYDTPSPCIERMYGQTMRRTKLLAP